MPSTQIKPDIWLAQIQRIGELTALALALGTVAALATLLGLRLDMHWLLTVSQCVAGAAALLKAKVAMDETRLVWRARRYAKDRITEIDKKAADPLKRSVREARNTALWSWCFVGLIAGIPFLVWIAKSVPQMPLAPFLTLYLIMLLAEVTFKATYRRLVEAMAESQNAPRVRVFQA